MLHDCCNIAAIAEHIEKPKSGLDSNNNSYNTHLDLSNNLLCCISEITQKPVSVNTCSITYSSDPGVAAYIDPNCAGQFQNRELEPYQPPNSVLQVQNTCKIVQHTTGMHTGELMAVEVKNYASDHKPREYPEPHVPCHSCGRGIRGMWRD